MNQTMLQTDHKKIGNQGNLKRGLKARQINMIAIGGTIGTGLFISSGATINAAGPGGALIAYLLSGLMVYFLMTSLGEMATLLPVSGSLIHDLCELNHIPVWCGGMLEAGIGRAHNIAITTLPNFTLPGDTAASSNYWEKDIIDPEVTVKNGVITVPDQVGIGYEPNRQQIEHYTLYSKVFKL
jgi:hypothetical protein